MRASIWIFLCVFWCAAPLFAQQGLLSTTFHDSSRAKDIPVDIFYPSQIPAVLAQPDTGEFPVVVFGHAMAVPVYSYRHLITAFGSEKFILVLPKTEMTMTPELEQFSTDIAFCAEEIWRQSKQDPDFVLYGKLDGAFAAVGHSLGGSSSIWAATRSNLFNTVVALSPPEIEPYPSDAAAQLDIPALVITGSADGVTSLGEHVLPIYTSFSSSCKMLLTIKGGSHCGFANSNWLCNLGEKILAPSDFISRKAQHQVTHDYLMPWLNYHLRADCDQLQNLYDFADVDHRIEFTSDCDALSKPCVHYEEGMLKAISPGISFKWNINGEEILGERFESVSMGYGSGVYQAEVLLDNKCVITSEEFWHHNAKPSELGGFRYRVYQPYGKHELVIEVFGADFPLRFTGYSTSGEQLLELQVTDNRQHIPIAENFKGLLHYALHAKGQSSIKGKIAIE